MNGQEKKFARPLKIYRKTIAFEFSIGKKGKLYISAAIASGKDAKGNTLFNWKGKGSIALDVFEIGAVIFYIENYFNPHCFDVSKKAASISSRRDGIYHRAPGGAISQCWFKGGEDRINSPCFHLNFAIEKGNDKSNYSITLGVAEATTLKILLKESIRIHHEWDLLLRRNNEEQNPQYPNQQEYNQPY